MQSIRSKPIPKAVLAFLGVLGIILICCWGLNYWWFDIAAYIRLEPYPKAVHIATTRHHYSDSGTPSFNYILIQRYEITGASLDQITTYYKKTIPKDKWDFICEGFDCQRCEDRECNATIHSSYVLRWYWLDLKNGESGDACVEIEPLTDEAAAWRITQWTRHGRIF